MYNGVKFDEENNFRTESFNTFKKAEKGIVGLVIKTGIANDSFQANFILLVFALVVLLISISIFAKGVFSIPTVSPEVLKQLNSMPRKR